MTLKVEVADAFVVLVDLARQKPLTHPRLDPNPFVTRLGMYADVIAICRNVAPPVTRKGLVVIP